MSIFLWILLIVAIFIVLFVFATFITFLVVEHHMKWVGTHAPEKGSPIYSEWQDFLAAEKEEWTIETFDGHELRAWYYKAPTETHKTVIVAIGYQNTRYLFAALGGLFQKLGYNVLMPAYRANAEYKGSSGGAYIGFGWLDRSDYLKWMDRLLEEDAQAEIALFGVSMGASTVMLLTGEALPQNVKVIISDCGYSSLWDEMVHKAKHDFHLPAFPLVHLVSFWSRLFAGYHYKEVNVLAALQKNTRPILFIHGEKDHFVPTEMVYKNFEATSAPKVLKVIPDAGHARSYESKKELYTQTITDFLAQYFE